MTELGLHIYDIVQNSITADASEIEITICEDQAYNRYTIHIKDNGCGIAPDKLEHVTDAFYTSRITRKVGLGLALLKQNAELANGHLKIESIPSGGTSLTVAFAMDHIDRPPAGDMVTTFGLLITTNPDINIIYRHKTPLGTFYIATNNIREAIGYVPINQPDVITIIKKIIAHNLEKIGAETFISQTNQP